MALKIVLPELHRPLVGISGRVHLVHPPGDPRVREALLAHALALHGDALLVADDVGRVRELLSTWLRRRPVAFRARSEGRGTLSVPTSGGRLWIIDRGADPHRLTIRSLRALYVLGAHEAERSPLVRLPCAEPPTIIVSGQRPPGGHWSGVFGSRAGTRVLELTPEAVAAAFPDQAAVVLGRPQVREVFLVVARRRLRIRTDKPAELLSAAQRREAEEQLGAGWQSSGDDMPLVSLEVSALQLRYLAMKRLWRRRGRRRFLLLKPRRGGFTTLECANSYALAVSRPNVRGVTLSHTREQTERAFETITTFHQHDPEAPMAVGKPSASHLQLENGAHLFVGTAGGRSFGRGDTLQRVHGTEVSSWLEGSRKVQKVARLMAGLTQACRQGEVVLETTANGHEWFCETYREAKRGLNDWVNIFLRWWDDPFNVATAGSFSEQELLDTLTDEERALVTRWRLTLAQIAFRREKQRELRVLFPQEYPEDDEECFLSSGVCYFDTIRVRALLRALEGYERKHLPGGYEVEWEAPRTGRRYVAGVDTSEGLPGCDPNGVGVLDLDTGAQVAAVHGLFNPRVLAEHAVRLAKRYNHALLGIERQNHGHAVLMKVADLGYGRPHNRGGRLFCHVAADDPEKSRPGWNTSAETRPVLIQELAGAIEDGHMKVRDADLLSECLTFRLQSDGKFEADPGAHDDGVIKWAIAWQMRKHFKSAPEFATIDL